MIRCAAAVAAWLEYYAPHSSTPERRPLATFPFIIGRAETAHLRIDSNRVSREHAQIVQDGDGFRVRDLGSTNGTFLNGSPVTESRLENGDLLMIADTPLSFCHQPEGGERGATQVMTRRADGQLEASPRAVIREVRRLQEACLAQDAPVRLRRLLDLEQQRPAGCLLAGPAPAPGRRASPGQELLARLECRISARGRELLRLAAAAAAEAAVPGGRLIVPLLAEEVSELSLAPWLARTAARLGESPAAVGGPRLVVTAPESSACGSKSFREFLAAVREAGAAVGYHGFAGGQSQAFKLPEARPDYLLLAPSLIQNLPRSPDRQRRLQAAVRTAGELGCLVAADGVRTAEEEAVCRNAGCRYALGDYYESPRG